MNSLTKYSFKKQKRVLLSVFLILSAFLGLQACKDNNNNDNQGDIVEVAQADGNFSSLVSTLQQTGVDTALKATGPFTVFAPTDEAFSNLPEGLLDSLSNEQLIEILKYHVVSSEIASSDLQAEQTVDALAGGQLFITSANGNVLVNGQAQVETADISASNGVIHAVNQVLLPDAFQDVVAIISKRYMLQTLEDAVVQANLVNTLQQDTQDGYTVFAPLNTAFDGIDLSSLSQQQLQDILTYHVLPSKILSADITSGTVTTVNGATIEINVAGDGTVSLTDQAGNTYQVTQADLEGTNGVVHIINGVLMPS